MMMMMMITIYFRLKIIHVCFLPYYHLQLKLALSYVKLDSAFQWLSYIALFSFIYFVWFILIFKNEIYIIGSFSTLLFCWCNSRLVIFLMRIFTVCLAFQKFYVDLITFCIISLLFYLPIMLSYFMFPILFLIIFSENIGYCHNIIWLHVRVQSFKSLWLCVSIEVLSVLLIVVFIFYDEVIHHLN